MRFGFAPVQSGTSFDAMRAQAALAELLGFGTLWAHEHHSQRMIYPAPLMTAAVLATATRRVRIGTNMLLLPLYHPLRVAEEAAMVDVLSEGRLTLGVAAGYAKDEFAAFGVALEERGRRMREGIELIRAAWTTRPLSTRGIGFALEGYELFPAPVQEPCPPIWVGAGAPGALRRAARLGDALLLSATQDLAGVRGAVATYRAADGGADKPIALNRVTHVVESRAARADAARFFSERYLSFYDRWGHPRITGLDTPARMHEITAREHFILGEASECVERLHEYAEAGVQEIACLMNFGKPELDIVERSMRLFAEKVVPFAP